MYQINKYYKHIGTECAGATLELQTQIIELKDKIKEFSPNQSGKIYDWSPALNKHELWFASEFVSMNYETINRLSDGETHITCLKISPMRLSKLNGTDVANKSENMLEVNHNKEFSIFEECSKYFEEIKKETVQLFLRNSNNEKNSQNLNFKNKNESFRDFEINDQKVQELNYSFDFNEEMQSNVEEFESENLAKEIMLLETAKFTLI